VTDEFKRWFDAMPCYLSVQDRDFHILHANQRFLKDFGNFQGRTCYQVYKRRSEKCEVCPVEATFYDGDPHRSEERVRCLDGKEVSVLVRTGPVRDEKGEVTAVIEMSTDVTMIKRLEDQLRQSRQRYHTLFEEAPCYITIQDPHLRIVEANRTFREDFGEALGCQCYDTYKHRTEECFPCPVQETFHDGKTHTREDVLTSLQGEKMNVLTVTAPIRDANGDIVRVMEMSENITEVRKLQSQLTSLGLLIGSVSHGLKGLLNGLSGGMYLVNSGFEKDNKKRVEQGWEMVQRNVVRIRSMVSDILYYAKERTPNWEPLSAVDVVNEVCGLMESHAQDHGVRLTTALDVADGRFEADVNAVRSMLTNLVENSIDACRLDKTKSDHEVQVRIRESDGHIAFEVEDNGIGMDRETREKAFTLFFSSKGTEGTGLGLFISNRIAEAHGGSIVLESDVGVGTRFIVSMPRTRPVAAADEPRDRVKEEKDG
jgi:PAS domain S-box-containing protein